MIIRSAAVAFLSCAAMLFQSHAARAAKGYDNCNGFIDALPAAISTQGVWCLRHDLATNIASGNVISISANNVTIDCNDFKVGGLAAGNRSQAIGIRAYGRQNTAIRHCNIRGFNFGIYLDGGAGNLVEDNRLDNNLIGGIYVDGQYNRVRRNAVYDTGGFVAGTGSGGTFAWGIDAAADIVDNVVDGVFTAGTTNTVIGIRASGAGMQASNNQISGLALNGGGTAFGIAAVAGIPYQTFVGNRVAAASASTNGSGIHGNDSSFCARNTVSGFAVGMDACSDDGDNGLH